ncbi:DUF4159 domain-containing protein [Rhodobacteraceae bacterium 2CG4]|uniref:DUF4159 domain-containing protein n=1 Tax=Halovulum marinum TaxID=2662447 RepID=A0A6L5Z773_9RHOB|nr:DUF4159 domain-containing protein [Halovulum marinum]MSU92239.1 DUF4159 domain-containing protein [Halovulum marinum]
MLSLGALSFLAPWLLSALVALPVLWWLLRAVPPAPARRLFPGVRLLLGLKDPERMPERTPWWLLLLRMAALAAAILAFADPVLNPDVRERGTGPVLLLLDGGWGSAPDWAQRQARAADILDQAARDGRPAAVISLAEPRPGEPRLPFRAAEDWATRIGGLAPKAWAPDRAGFAAWLETVEDEGFETVWLTDGLGTDGDRAFFDALADRGPVRMIADPRTPLALTAPGFADGALQTQVLRPEAGAGRSVEIAAIGADPLGIERVLGTQRVVFEPDDGAATEVALELPVELRNRVTRLTIPGERSAGAVALADDGLKRRKVGLLAGGDAGEAQRLVDPLHYLRTALEDSTDLIEAPLDDILSAQPDVIVFADVGAVAETERARLIDWIESGGLLVRFAGPRLAASGEGQLEEDALLPVRLRAGGRSVGGAMSWGAPKALRPFREGSPFFGLETPEEVNVTSQVMAQPDPELAERVLAALEDGTPLVTGRAQGEGRVVLFHVTANAEWSSLPLSGLFVQMLERLAVSARVARPAAEDLAGQTWTPVTVLDGFGNPVEPRLLAGVDGARLIDERPSAEMPPGVYSSGERTVAVNLFRDGDMIAPIGALPAGIVVESMQVAPETPLKPWLLLAALLALAADILATLWLSGRLTGPRMAQGTAVLLAVTLAGPLAATLAVPQARAQQMTEDELALHATTDTVLAYVVTGDRQLDQTSEAGLRGLSQVLTRRTAIEPVDPVGVQLERDDLAFFPFLYWPVSEVQRPPSDAAYAKLNEYLRSGGMILFDTRDANLGGRLGSGTANGRTLQQLAAKLDIPPLEPAPQDHVLTRTFYLLQDFPGRYSGSEVWVEAAPDVEEVEGMPFRDLNDGVTPVVIGANDWAAAWAVDARGAPMYPVGRGTGGAQQREMAYRFGVNLIMHVMTGNYKSDQVHVPALLERLGN